MKKWVNLTRKSKGQDMENDFVVNWGGKYFGWIENGELFTRDGRHVGRFLRSEVFGKNGRYLGEIKNHRLITNVAKKENGKKSLPFRPQMAVLDPTVSPGNERAHDMIAGYEDFPFPETL